MLFCGLRMEVSGSIQGRERFLPANDRVVSHISLWEITIKVSTGRLRIDREDLEQALIDIAVEELPIGREHILGVASLPFIHRDPFDRLLIAQAKIENLVLATHNRKFSQYGISLLPALLTLCAGRDDILRF